MVTLQRLEYIIMAMDSNFINLYGLLRQTVKRYQTKRIDRMKFACNEKQIQKVNLKHW